MKSIHFFSSRYVLNWAEKENFDLSPITFCTGRQLLKKLMLTTSNLRGIWSFWIYVFKGTVFIESDPEVPNYYDANKAASWGTKFEDIMRTGGTGTPGYKGEDIAVRVTRVVNIGQHHILTCSKVDCQLPGRMKDVPENYIEVKTNTELDNRNDQKWFTKNKTQAVWAHCLIGNVSTVYFGFHTRQGLLTSVSKYTSADLEKQGEPFWKPGEMLSFLDTLLTWIRENVEEGASYTLDCDGDTISLSKKELPLLVNMIHKNHPG